MSLTNQKNNSIIDLFSGNVSPIATDEPKAFDFTGDPTELSFEDNDFLLFELHFSRSSYLNANLPVSGQTWNDGEFVIVPAVNAPDAKSKSILVIPVYGLNGLQAGVVFIGKAGPDENRRGRFWLQTSNDAFNNDLSVRIKKQLGYVKAIPGAEDEYYSTMDSAIGTDAISNEKKTFVPIENKSGTISKTEKISLFNLKPIIQFFKSNTPIKDTPVAGDKVPLLDTQSDPDSPPVAKLVDFGKFNQSEPDRENLEVTLAGMETTLNDRQHKQWIGKRVLVKLGNTDRGLIFDDDFGEDNDKCTIGLKGGHASLTVKAWFIGQKGDPSPPKFDWFSISVNDLLHLEKVGGKWYFDGHFIANEPDDPLQNAGYITPVAGLTLSQMNGFQVTMLDYSKLTELPDGLKVNVRYVETDADGNEMRTLLDEDVSSEYFERPNASGLTGGRDTDIILEGIKGSVFHLAKNDNGKLAVDVNNAPAGKLHMRNVLLFALGKDGGSPIRFRFMADPNHPEHGDREDFIVEAYDISESDPDRRWKTVFKNNLGNIDDMWDSGI